MPDQIPDEQLHRWIEHVDYVDAPEGRELATEVLAARVRIAELEEARDIAEGQARLHCHEAITAGDDLAEARARIAELEEGRDIQLIEMRGAMRDVRRILADLGVTNIPPRLAAALEGLDQ